MLYPAPPIPKNTAVSVAQRRKNIATAINQVLSAASTRTDSCVTDAMVYGKKFGCAEICGVDWSGDSDSFGFTMRLCSHICDVIIVMRWGDPRIGVFLPNALVEGLDNEIGDALRMLLGATTEQSAANLSLLARGFDAYPMVGVGDYPNLMARRHEHGVYLEFCYGASMASLLNAALSGQAPAEVAGDALGYAAMHIVHTISAHVHLAETRQRVTRGMTNSVEFKHRAGSAELIRNYNLEPSQLEILREAQGDELGEYVLHFMEHERENLSLFLSEVVEVSLQNEGAN